MAIWAQLSGLSNFSQCLATGITPVGLKCSNYDYLSPAWRERDILTYFEDLLKYRQTGLISWFSGSHPSCSCWKMDIILKMKFSNSFYCRKIAIYFDYTFKLRASSVIVNYTVREVTSQWVSHWGRNKNGRHLSEILKTPNWLALTPLQYMLPYH